MLHPDPPSRHHLPFDKLTALSKAEGPFDRGFERRFDKLRVDAEQCGSIEGLRCLRSLLCALPREGAIFGPLFHGNPHPHMVHKK
jgi:hypothetical protein